MRLYLSFVFWLLAFDAAGQFNPEAADRINTDISPPEVIHWTAGTAQIDQHKTVAVDLQLRTSQDFSIYTDKLTVIAVGRFTRLHESTPTPTTVKDPITGDDTKVYRGGDFRFFFKYEDANELNQISIAITYLGCTAKICLFPFTETLNISVHPSSDTLLTETPTIPESAPEANAAESFESKFARQIKAGELSTWMLFVVLFLGGLATNLTPCVAPMIPITIRLLARQKFSPTLNASIYALGIMLSYTLLGSIATFSGSAFGTFMSMPSVNIIFAAVMAVLGLSMLGFGDLSALQNIGSRIGSGQPSAKNTLLMGAGAGLVAAPCTGPVLGALLTYSAGRAAPLEGIALMTMYSFGFALPYVFLGRAANSVTRIKVSPIVQITTKLFFAAIMFALCFYYFRIPFYEVVKAAKAHWTILAWIFGITGLSGIVTCVLVPRLQNAKMVMVLPCILFGFAIFSSWQALTTVVESKETKLAWHQDIEGAVVAAKLSGKNILIDNWAEWCEACKKMDVTTFMDADVRATLGKDWEIVKLDLTEGTEADDQHLAAYEITGLPTLVLLPPTGDIHQRENIVGYVTGSELLQRLKAFKDR